MPPLAKFAAASFGIVERFAEPDGVAMLPITLRNVEADLKIKALSPASGKVSDLKLEADADIIAWFRKVKRFDDYSVPRSVATREVKGALPQVLADEDKTEVQARMVSLLQGQAGVRTLDLPKPASGDPRPFEVVGIPRAPVSMCWSWLRKLGSALLDQRHGAGRTT